MNACNPQEPLSEAQIALNIKHYEYSQQFGANYLNRFDSNLRDCHSYQFQRQNEMNQKIKQRCLNNVGPPPRPFKKARYAWEIKNYDYTLRRMSQPSEEEGSSQENVPEGEIPEMFVTPSNVLQINSSYDINEVASTDNVTDSRSEYIGPIMPPVFPPHYENLSGSDTGQNTALVEQSLVQQEVQQITPVDPDARLIRWHTRQLCRSIFDNTVNRMLENMGFSPVTSASQGLHPLLVLNLSDDEDREQHALETHALSTALQQKGLIPPPFQYDAVESVTTSDYDSSEEEESELGDTGGSDDFACEAPQDPYITYLPVGLSVTSLVADKQNPDNFSNPKLANECDVNCPSAQNICDFKNDCDALHISHPQRDLNVVPNCGDAECGKDTITATLNLDDNENCIPKSQTLIEGKVEQVLENEKSSENNNNDKFFIRNAIEMAIKQHGLGFQKA